MAKNAPFLIVAYKKFSWLGKGGAIAPWPPPKYATVFVQVRIENVRDVY